MVKPMMRKLHFDCWIIQQLFVVVRKLQYFSCFLFFISVDCGDIWPGAFCEFYDGRNLCPFISGLCRSTCGECTSCTLPPNTPPPCDPSESRDKCFAYFNRQPPTTNVYRARQHYLPIVARFFVSSDLDDRAISNSNQEEHSQRISRTTFFPKQHTNCRVLCVGWLCAVWCKINITIFTTVKYGSTSSHICFPIRLAFYQHLNSPVAYLGSSP